MGPNFECSMPKRTTTYLLLPLVVLAAQASAPARADFIALKGGGEIRGELFSNPNGAAKIESISIRTLSGATVTVARDEISAVVRRRLIAEEYETRRRAVSATVAGHWEIAEWCRRQSMSQERLHHLRLVLDLDPEHEAARRGLGYVRDQERWTTRDEMLADRGYVRHKGKHVLPQELELTQKQERLRQAERTWFKRVKQWQLWLDGERSDRKSAAVKGLTDIRHSDAIPALVSSFQYASEEEQRLLLVNVLSKIEGDRPVAALVTQSVLDDSRAVRDAAIGSLRRRGAAPAIPILLEALKSRLNTAVNRAAAALGQLADEKAVPYLIDALITRHDYYVEADDEGLSQYADDEPEGPPVVLGPSVGREKLNRTIHRIDAQSRADDRENPMSRLTTSRSLRKILMFWTR